MSIQISAGFVHISSLSIQFDLLFCLNTYSNSITNDRPTENLKNSSSSTSTAICVMLRYVLDLVSQGLLNVSIASAVGQRTQVVKTDTMHSYAKVSHVTK